MEWNDTPRTKRLRDRMVREQLQSRGIKDPRVIAVMKEVPRHWFCSAGISEEEAYGDFPLPIGWGQTISQPLMVADMLEQMRLTGTETVLEIGTGSGYNAALLSRLAQRVVSLEILPELAELSRQRLIRGGFDNVEVHQADGTLGWAAAAPPPRRDARCKCGAGSASSPTPRRNASIADGGHGRRFRAAAPAFRRHDSRRYIRRSPPIR